MGRATACTPELTERVAEALRKYGFVKPVMLSLGLSERQHYDWVEHGNTDIDEGRDTTPFAVYAHTVKRAIGEWQLQHLDRLQSGPNGWASSGWSLERSDPNTFGQKSRIEHSGSVSADQPSTPPPDLRQRLREMGLSEERPH